MIFKEIKLKDFYPNITSDAILQIMSFVYEDGPRSTRPCMLTVPGGGYSFCSEREADPICIKFVNLGYITATLHYTVNDGSFPEGIYPNPQLELMAAMDYLNKNAEEFYINKNEINIIGFSAGGHLAGSYGFLYKNEEFLNILNVNKDNVKPYSISLCYPVITLGIDTHGGSKDCLIGNRKELIDDLSIEKHVSGDYPPTFIWTTSDDVCVPPVNSVLMTEALKKANVYHKYVVFPKGNHGRATADILTNAPSMCFEDIARYPSMIDEFIKSIKIL